MFGMYDFGLHLDMVGIGVCVCVCLWPNEPTLLPRGFIPTTSPRLTMSNRSSFDLDRPHVMFRGPIGDCADSFDRQRLTVLVE